MRGRALVPPDRHNSLKIKKSRGGQIRTDDFLLPKQALYQAELRPVRRAGTLEESTNQIKVFFACTEIPPAQLDSRDMRSDVPSHDRGVLRPENRDFSTREKDPSNLTRVMPP